MVCVVLMIRISSSYLFVLSHKTLLIDVFYLITKGSEDEPDKILRYTNGIRKCALKKIIKPVILNLHAHVLTEDVWNGQPIEVHASQRAKYKEQISALECIIKLWKTLFASACSNEDREERLMSPKRKRLNGEKNILSDGEKNILSDGD